MARIRRQISLDALTDKELLALAKKRRLPISTLLAQLVMEAAKPAKT